MSVGGNIGKLGCYINLICKMLAASLPIIYTFLLVAYPLALLLLDELKVSQQSL